MIANLLTPRSLAVARTLYHSLQATREECLRLLQTEQDVEEVYRLRKTLEIAERGMLCALKMHGAKLLEVQ